MSYQTLFNFEQQLAKFTGAPFVVVTDSCTHAMELCLRYDQIKQCEFTAFTYMSVPMLMHLLSVKYKLTDEEWVGEYQLHGTRIWDSARRLENNMYRPGQMQCLSFGNGKPMQLGRVGAVLLDDLDAYNKISCWRSDGRDLRITPWIDQVEFEHGYHYCPTLELCDLGTTLLSNFVSAAPVAVKYPDCRLLKIKI
jgi:dTDP-4-amino-4,6-dideoxygalactose transaminase